MNTKNHQLAQISALTPSEIGLQSFVYLTTVLEANGTTFDKELFKAADAKLIEFQKSPEAWQLCTDLLLAHCSDQQRFSEHTVFQACSILKNKMTYDFVALTLLAQGSDYQLRSRLLQIVGQLKTKAYIMNSLAKSVALLVIHTHLSWPTAIDDLHSSLKNNTDQAHVLLKILVYMANDCDNIELVIDDSTRKSFYNFCASVCREKVFKEILDHWSSSAAAASNEVMGFSITEAFHSWVRIQLPQDFYCRLVFDCPNLMALLIGQFACKRYENIEMAATCVVELLQISRHVKEFWAITEYVTGKIDQVLTCATRVIQSQDCERGMELSMVFGELAISHMDHIIGGQTQIVDVLIQLLEKIPELTCRNQMPFWKKLFGDLKDKPQKTEQFGSLFLRLIQCINAKAVFPLSLFSELNQLSIKDDEFCDIVAMRKDLGSLVRNMVKCCGFQPIMSYTSKMIEQHYHSQCAETEKLRQIEACVFMLTELCATTSAEISQSMELLLLAKFIVDLPTQNHKAVRLEATRFIANIARMLSKTDIVPMVLKYVLNGFDDTLTLQESSFCFYVLCKENLEVVAPFAIEIAQQICVPTFVEKWNMDTAYIDILRGLGLLVPTVCKYNLEQGSELLKKVIMPLLAPISLKVQQHKSSAKPNSKLLNEISEKLTLLGDFVKSCAALQDLVSCNRQNPFLPIFSELWPFIDGILIDFCGQEDVIEQACRIVKYSQRALGNQFLPYLQNFLKSAMHAYQRDPSCASFVYSVEFSFQEFGHQPIQKTLFTEAVDFVIQVSQEYLTTRAKCEQNSDLTNDIFGLAIRVLSQNRQLFFAITKLEQLIRFSMLCIGLSQEKATKAHSQFMVALIQSASDDSAHLEGKQIWQFLRSQGPKLVSEYVQVLMQAPPRQVQCYLVDVLTEVCMKFVGESASWVHETFKRDVPVTVLTNQEKSYVLELLNVENVNRSKVYQEFEILAKRARSQQIR